MRSVKALCLLWLWLCLCPVVAVSQGDLLRVVVTSAVDSKPIGSAVVTCYDAKGQGLGYRLTDAKGVALLPKGARPIHLLKVRKMGYKEAEVMATTLEDGHERVVLEEKSEVLPEFTYTIPAIERKRDTLVYQASAFISPQDSYLGDLLKKLPGIRVNERGVVYYQGEPIKHFYIEGKDLLGHQYSLATKNLSVDAVSKVEVLEQHQEVKMLQGVVPESRSSMNVVLKEGYKVKVFGYLEGGAGYEPVMYSGKANATKVSKSPLQYYLQGGADTYNPENAFTTNAIDVSDLAGLQPAKGRNFSTLPNSYGLPAKYYMYPKDYRLSGNGLLTLSDDAQVRGMVTSEYIGYMESVAQYEHYKEIDVDIEEHSRRWGHQWSLRPEVEYKLNSPRRYLSNKLYGALNRGGGHNQYLRSGKEQLSQLNHTVGWVQNNLRASMPLNERRSLMVHVQSDLLYAESSDRLILEQPTAALHRQEWQANHGASTFIGLPNALRAEISLNDHLYYRAFEMEGSKNEVYHNELLLQPKLLVPLFHNRSLLTLEAELTHTSQKIAKLRSQLWGIAPSLRFSYKDRRGWEYLLSAKISRGMPLESSYFADPYLISHRTMVEDYQESYRTQSQRLYMKANYSNAIEYLFATLSLHAMNSQSPVLLDMSIASDGFATISTINQDNYSRSLSGEVKLDKTFSQHGLNILFDGQFGIHSRPASLNRVVTQSRQHFWQSEVGLRYNQISWLDLSGTLGYSRSKVQRGNESEWVANDQYSTKVSALFILTKELTFKLNHEWMQVRGGSEVEYPSLQMLGFNMDYAPSKRLKLSLQCHNLLNTSLYTVINRQPILESTTQLLLRPRSLFLTLHWNY